ncbi:hypothetical protein TOT_020000561 [Theileria orientalis strain Shintoku]|uniref:Uncharacterized protein n=1 Tax=Theileria orientalis strain Shintoku TaxID=869250 RepID=J4CD05_THEOR|nr:hypothetical protein TOT_020000561 [Theileria orientalis strain Shintoku]BAM40302.1 hypothetical protein TOT_020000561 [Theileria orientalis strain Shintoku]|eukprot:XP_009690603.1 hypothetical protein TOT_020000561 [Theileria orientalis strain Shintoku]
MATINYLSKLSCVSTDSPMIQIHGIRWGFRITLSS